LLGPRVAGDDRGTELDRRTNAGGTGNPSAAIRARLAAFTPMVSAEARGVDPSPMRTICIGRLSLLC
jgi:hypothetical protein